MGGKEENGNKEASHEAISEVEMRSDDGENRHSDSKKKRSN